MNTQITAIPKLYIGMDIHKKQWTVHMRTDICDHRGFSMEPSPEALYSYVTPLVVGSPYDLQENASTR